MLFAAGTRGGPGTQFVILLVIECRLAGQDARASAGGTASRPEVRGAQLERSIGRPKQARSRIESRPAFYDHPTLDGALAAMAL